MYQIHNFPYNRSNMYIKQSQPLNVFDEQVVLTLAKAFKIWICGLGVREKAIHN